MRGLTDEQKAEARRRYESGEPMASIAADMRLHRNTLNRLRDAGGWDKTAHVSANVSVTRNETQQRAQAMVIDMASRRVVEQAETSGIIAQAVDEIAESVKQHGKLSRLLMQYAEQMLEEAIAGTVRPGEKQSRADVFNSVISGVGRAVEKSREIAGLKAGQVSAKADAQRKPSILKLVVVDKPEQQSKAS